MIYVKKVILVFYVKNVKSNRIIKNMEMYVINVKIKTEFLIYSYFCIF